MDIQFIWIEKWNTIEKQGLDFGGKYRCHYEYETGEFTVDENENYISGFFTSSAVPKKFRKSELTSITAIIGENGAGKSSILRWLMRERYRSSEGFILVFKDAKDMLHVYRHSGLKWQIPEDMSNIEIADYPVSADQLHRWYPPFMEHTQLVFYTNIFEARGEADRIQLYDISTSFLMRNGMNSFDPKFSRMHVFRVEEIKRQLSFLQARVFANQDQQKKEWHLRQRIPFPKRLVARFQSAYRLLQEESIHVAVAYQFLSEFKEFCRALSLSTAVTTVLSFMIEHVFLEASRANILIPSHLMEDFNEYFKSENPDVYEQIANWFKAIGREVLPSHGNDIRGILSGTADLVLWFKDVDVRRMPFDVRFDVVEDQQEIDKLLSIYAKCRQYHDFLSLDWPGLSSGENSLLTMFSRLHLAAEEMRNQQQPKKQLILLIDEGETYFHPQWQKEFIKILVDYLPYLFENCLIQVILTSNSPFVASDLPNSNVIFLKRENSKTVVLDSLDEQSQTFAANIHALLANSFFLQDGLIGSFAKEKINEIIVLLQKPNEKITEQQILHMEKMINLIGEPLLRDKLSQMLSMKFATRFTRYEASFESLERRVAKLEKDKP